ncbi:MULTISPECIES: ABC transporter ATP-binding protein [Enterobacteriaceae]|uniref:ATP-binding cassette domain-containing protein n=1 Tax=Raoultella lignicola TaxID=3040939 RepID=A0ABU9F7R6_9ENTR|nr:MULTISPECIES: ATP-binding cassette domain-containing protein [Enterobacteriaceae]MRT49296.1 ATP-binding cassette domain-containing protein [Raoultella sp. RIT712]QNK07412.1 ATP-binding cassette domain-containing protein [Enterobacter sp. JUb54]ROS10693.1 molybdate transport system ATP-binding protein [Raoultella sp. BIGb0399]
MLRVEQIATLILQEISFHVPKGSCVAIVGPSGSGKTTLLNAIAGGALDRGAIYLDGQRIDGLPAWQRPCRYLNQRLYLFPYLTVRGNLALAQYAAALPRDKKQQMALLDEMGIAHLAQRYPRQISGGEQQRVALARAMISRPRLLLLDEPFSSLDRETRSRLWEVVRMLRRQAVTIVMVTHDPEEAEALADKQLMLYNGRLVAEVK